MSRTGSWVSCKLRSILEVLRRHMSFSSYISQEHRPGFSIHKNGNGYDMMEGSKFYSTNSKTLTKLDGNR